MQADGGGVGDSVILAVAAVVALLLPPRASMMRQRARYSSSSVGLSIRCRIERFPLVHCFWDWKAGVGVVGELIASTVIFFFLIKEGDILGRFLERENEEEEDEGLKVTVVFCCVFAYKGKERN